MKRQNEKRKKSDEYFIARTLQLARKGIPFTSPNPLCGAVIVKNGKIKGWGYHKRYGEKHAEIVALESVKDKRELRGSTLYCNLEPCSHYGKTPPCTERIIKEGIKEVVYAMEDPNPKVLGKEVLEKAGIKVRAGIMEREAKELNEWYIKWMKWKKPYITLKVASSLDGKMATLKGESKWITQKKARDFANQLRCQNDAVLVGINTILKDNPQLTCRAIGGKQIKRIILDSSLVIPLQSRLFRKPGEIIIFTEKKESPDWRKVAELEKRGARVIPVRKKEDLLSWSALLAELYKLGCAKVLIEGGAKVISSALEEGIVDRIFLFLSPKILGKGLAFTERLFLGSLKKAIKLKEAKVKRIGEDFLFTAYVHRYY